MKARTVQRFYRRFGFALGETIPEGTEVQTAGGLSFFTIGSFTATAEEVGDAETHLEVEAAEEGSAYEDLAANTINVLVTPLSFITETTNIFKTSASTESIRPQIPQWPLFWERFRRSLARVLGDDVPVFLETSETVKNNCDTWCRVLPSGEKVLDVEVNWDERRFGFHNEHHNWAYDCTVTLIANPGRTNGPILKQFFDAQIALTKVLPLVVGGFSKIPPSTELVSPFSTSVESPRKLTGYTDPTAYTEPTIELVERLGQETTFDQQKLDETNIIQVGWSLRLLTFRENPANVENGGVIQ